MPHNAPDSNALSSLKEKPHYVGHRARLRTRILSTQGKGVADYELIEYFLSLVIPRTDVKPLAKKLLAHFKSLSALLAVDPHELKQISGVGDSLIATFFAFQELITRILKEEAGARPIFDTAEKVIHYCQFSLSHRKAEEFRVLFLDTKNYLIEEEFHQSGTINHAPIYPREVIKKALALGASGIILVHNHPSGDPSPSQSDIEMTLEMRLISEKLGIRILDHIIVGKGTSLSLKSLGYL